MSMVEKVALSIKNRNLEKATEKQKDRESFVYECVKTRGVEQFKMASDRLKSDAKFVMDMLAICPECLAE